MRGTTGLLLCCLGLLAACLLTAWSDVKALAAANAAIAELDQRIAASEARARVAASRIGAAERESRQLEQTLSALTASAPNPATPRLAATSAAAIEWAKRWEKQLQDPVAQNENLAIMRARLREKFAPLYRTLHLTPGQIAAFEENEAMYQARQSDLNAALLQQRIGVMDPIAAKLFGQLTDEENKAQKAVLGEDGFAAFHEFQRTAMVRDMVGHMIGATTVMGEPLNSGQADQLIGVIAGADKEYATGGFAGMHVDWDRALAAAQPILSPAQLAVLEDLEPTGGGRFWSLLNAAVADATKNEPKSAPGQ